MTDDKKINYHIGARELELENVKLMLPNIGNIKDFICGHLTCSLSNIIETN